MLLLAGGAWGAQTVVLLTEWTQDVARLRLPVVVASDLPVGFPGWGGARPLLLLVFRDQADACERLHLANNLHPNMIFKTANIIVTYTHPRITSCISRSSSLLSSSFVVEVPDIRDLFLHDTVHATVPFSFGKAKGTKMIRLNWRKDFRHHFYKGSKNLTGAKTDLEIWPCFPAYIFKIFNWVNLILAKFLHVNNTIMCRSPLMEARYRLRSQLLEINPHTWTSYRGVLVFPKQPLMPRYLSVAKAFEGRVWGGVVVALGAAWAVGRRPLGLSGVLHLFCTVSWPRLGTLRRPSARLLATVLFLFSVVFITLFQSRYYEITLVPPRYREIDTVNDFKQSCLHVYKGKLNKIDHISSETIRGHILSTLGHYDGTQREFLPQDLQDRFVLVSREDFDKMKGSRCVAFLQFESAVNSEIWHKFGKNFTLTFAATSTTSILSLAYLPFHNRLLKLSSMITESGHTKKHFLDEMRTAMAEKAPRHDPSDERRALLLGDLSLAFFLLAVGLSAAALVFLGELVVARRTKATHLATSVTYS